MTQNDIITTIVFRGGSKGCPGKHTRELAGSPLFMWTLGAAVKFGAPIIIATDIKHEIKPIVATADFGDIPVVLQHPEPTDGTPKVPAVRGAAKDAEHHYGREFPFILDLDATAPLRTQADIEAAVTLLESEPDTDCVLSATMGVGRNPYFNLLEVNRWGVLVRSKAMDLDVAEISARQEAPAVFEANSSVYVYRREFLMDKRVISPLDGRCSVSVMPDDSFYHIDSELDFEIVEFLMKQRLGEVAETGGIPEAFKFNVTPPPDSSKGETRAWLAIKRLRVLETISNQIRAIHVELKRE